MHTIRERSHIILWTLLFFFVASMTVGGLVGGANILDRIIGRNQSNLYVGSVDGTDITHQEFSREQENQLRSQRQSGTPIDSRAMQNARNSAWNTLVDKVIQNKKLKEMNLQTSGDEIYEFMLLTPPTSLQDQLTQGGFFADSSGNFQINDYQTALRTGTYPAQLDQFWLVWENYLETFLPNRKLQNVYNHTGSVSEYEVRRDFEKKNTKCTVEYIYIATSSVDDSLIIVSDEDIEARYLEDQERLYKLEPSKTVEFVFWSNDLAAVDSSLHSTYLDSVNSDALKFASEADFSGFYAAIDTFGVSVEDTLDIIEGYAGNSGIPFRMGVLRNAVRFAFDNPIGTISDPLSTDNGIAIFHILGDKPGGFKPLSEVSENIRRTLTREFKKGQAKTLLVQAASGDLTDLPAIAENNELVSFATDTSKTIGSSFASIGRSNSLTGSLRAMSAGDISEPIETFSSIVILRLLEKDEFDEEKFAEDHDSIRDQLLRTKQTSIYSTWLADHKDNLTIEDLRSKSY